MFQIQNLEPDTEYMIAAKIIYNDGRQSPEEFNKLRTKKLNQPPKTPINISASSKSSSSITVGWDLQSGNFDSTSRYFEIRVRNPAKKGKKRDRILNANVSPNTDGSYYFTLDDLKPFTKYELVVRQVLDEVDSKWSMSVEGKAENLDFKIYCNINNPWVLCTFFSILGLNAIRVKRNQG